MIDTLFIDLDETLIKSMTATIALFDNLADIFFNDINLGDSIWQLFKKHSYNVFPTLPHTDYLRDIACDGYDVFLSNFEGEDSRIIELKNTASTYYYSVLNSIIGELGYTDHIAIELIISFIKEKWIDYYDVFSDTYTLLNECKCYKKYILTNGFFDVQMKKIYQCGLNDKIDGIFISGMFGIGKPAKEFFDNVLSSTGIDKNSAVMIGDGLSDIIGASNIGMKTIWKKSIYNASIINNINPTVIIENLNEISTALLSM